MPDLSRPDTHYKNLHRQTRKHDNGLRRLPAECTEIEDFDIKIEVSGLIFIAFFLKGLTVNGKDAGCQLPYIFVVIIDGFNISISLIGMADIVAEPENTFVTGRGFDIILMCKVETKVIAERTVKRVQILIIPVYSM